MYSVIAGHELNWYEIVSFASTCHLPALSFTSRVWAGEDCGGEGSLGKQRCLAWGHFGSWPQIEACKLHLTAGGGSSCSLLSPGCMLLLCPWVSPGACQTLPGARSPHQHSTNVTCRKEIVGATELNQLHEGSHKYQRCYKPRGWWGSERRRKAEQGRDPHVPQGQWALRSAQTLVAPKWPSETWGQWIH